MFKVRWDILYKFCHQFSSLSSNKSTLKIG